MHYGEITGKRRAAETGISTPRCCGDVGKPGAAHRREKPRALAVLSAHPGLMKKAHPRERGHPLTSSGQPTKPSGLQKPGHPMPTLVSELWTFSPSVLRTNWVLIDFVTQKRDLSSLHRAVNAVGMQISGSAYAERQALSITDTESCGGSPVLIWGKLNY